MVPRNLWHAPIIPTVSDMNLHDTPAATALSLRPYAAETGSRPYTDRSNCRKAMLKEALTRGLLPEAYAIVGEAPAFHFVQKAALAAGIIEGYRLPEPTPAPDAGKPALIGPDITAATGPHPLDIPASLKRPPETPDQKRVRERMVRDTIDRKIKNPPSRASAASKGLGMSPFAMKEAGAKPKSDKKPTRKTSGSSKRSPRKAGERSGGGEKGAEVLRLIGRAKGATVDELCKATKWLPHTLRAWLSTKVGTKKLDRTRVDGVTSYKLKG